MHKRINMNYIDWKIFEKKLTSLKYDKSKRKKIYTTSSFDKKRKNHNNIIIKIAQFI